MPGSAANAPERTGEFDELPQKATLSIPNKLAKEIVPILKRLVSTGRSAIPILRNIAVVTKDGVTRVFATDLETAVTFRVPGVATEDSAVTLPFSAVETALKGKSKENLKIQTENNKATLSVGSAESGSDATGIASYPEIPALPEKIGSVPAEGLRKAIRMTMPAIAAEESRFTLNGALIELKDGKGRMVATDGHRLSVQDFPAPGVKGEHKLLVSRHALETVAKLFAKEPGDLEMKFSQAIAAI